MEKNQITYSQAKREYLKKRQQETKKQTETQTKHPIHIIKEKIK